jgi:hypothetical protein
VRTIPGYTNLYSLDDDGRVYSHVSGIYLKPVVNRRGYLYVGLRKNGKTTNFFIHRLVMTILKGQVIPENMEVDHEDKNKQNNRPDNLRILSHRDNTLHHHNRLGADTETQKFCCTCKKLKSRTVFGFQASSTDKLDGSCKPCMRVYKSQPKIGESSCL